MPIRQFRYDPTPFFVQVRTMQLVLQILQLPHIGFAVKFVLFRRMR